MGSVGLLILGLQPLLLGSLLTEGRISFDALALMATLEIIAIGLGSVVFPIFLSGTHIRLKALLLLCLVAVGHAATAMAPSTAILITARSLSGLAEGGLVAIAVEMIARAASPSRSGGWFVLIQTLLQSALALVLALWVIPANGSKGGFMVLVGATLLTAVLVPLLPATYRPLSDSASTAEESKRKTNFASWAALLSIFSLYLFIGAIWAFLEPLGAQFGIDATTVGVMVSASLAAQVIGAGIATLLVNRINFRLVMAAAAIAAIVIAGLFTSGPPLWLFWVLVLATGFLWLFVVPWQIGMTIEVDESRKTALLVPAAQLFGAALGPAGAAAFITATDFRGTAWFGLGAAIGSLLFFVLAIAIQRKN
jgi:predicted MFS family arabinose efflux permease